MTDDFRARLRQAWTEEHGHAPTWVEEILIDTYAEHMDAAMGRIIGDATGFRPTGFLGAAAEVVVETEEQRVTRVLVPLVRVAAADEQTEALRQEADLAVWFAPEPTPYADGWAYGDLVKAQFVDMLDSWNPEGRIRP